MRNLLPAVQEYVHRRGTAGHVQTSVSYYLCPTDAASAANLRASFAALLCTAEAESAKERMRALPVRAYLDMLPDHASQRVLRSVLLEISGSTTFLNGSFGLNVGSLHRSRERVDLALVHSAACEMQCQRVRSDVTVAGQRRLYLQSVREAEAEHLADEHRGGPEAKAEQCEAVGIDLRETIEEVANQLGEFSAEEVEVSILEGRTAVGAAPIPSGSNAR